MTSPQRPTGIAPRVHRGASALALAIACGWSAPAAAGPEGGEIAYGAAAIDAAGAVTTVRQTSDRVIIDWRSFDVTGDETVRFAQPGTGSIALNRVAAGAQSRIEGAIEANGQVWLINPSGVMFGGGAQVDVGGLVVSSVDISNENFIAGRMRFDIPGDPGASIVNEGAITFAEAGLAGFVAPEIINRGQIAGRLGRITMAGKDGFSVDISGDGLFEIDLADAAPAANARLVNEGALLAEGGIVVIDAASTRNALDGIVALGGVIAASSVSGDGGRIILSGDALSVTGRIDASSGAGKGGVITMTGDTVLAAPSARIDASGGAGGGVLRVGAGGGILHVGALAPPSAPMPARRTVVSAGAEIRADGGAGAGGDILVWGDEVAVMRGALSATGETGGMIEVSSIGELSFTGAADASGLSADGIVLFDPTFLIIGADGTDDGELSDNAILSGDGSGTFVISATALGAVSGALILQAADTLTVEQAVTFTGGDLTLEAGRDIVLGADVSASGALRLRANAVVAGAPSVTDGSIRLTSARSLRAGGALSLSVGATGVVDGQDMGAGDVLQLEAGGTLSAPGLRLAGNFTAQSSGTLDVLGVIDVGGALDLDSNGGAVRVGGALSDTSATRLSIDASNAAAAGNVTVQLGGALTLGPVIGRNVNILSFGGIIAPDMLDLRGPGTFLTKSSEISLGSTDNIFAGELRFVTITNPGAATADVTVRAADRITLSQMLADNVVVEAGGRIVQTGAAAIDGKASFTAGDVITLNLADNAFGGALSLSGVSANVITAGSVILGDSALGTLALTAGGAISQSGALDISGLTIVRTSGDEVRLDASANRFGGAVQVDTNFEGAQAADVTLAADGALSLWITKVDALSVTAGGAITQIDLITTNGDARFNAGGALTLNRSNVFGGDLDLFSDGGKIILNLQAGTVAGLVSADARETVPAVTSLAAARVGDVVLRINGAARIGDVHANDATVFGSGGINATGALSILGASRFQSSSSAITLSNASNSFGGPVTLLGVNRTPAVAGNISVVSGGDITLGQVVARGLTITSGGAIGQGAALDVAANASLTAVTDIDLSNSSNGFDGEVSMHSEDAHLGARGNVTLGAVDVASLTLQVIGALDQTAALQVDGALTLDVGGAATLVRTDNRLATVSGEVRGARVELRDANGFAFDGFSGAEVRVGAVGDRQAGEVTLSGVFGAGSAIRTVEGIVIAAVGGASLGDAATLDAGGAIRGLGALTLGADAALTAGGAVDLSSVQGGDATINAASAAIDVAALTGALSLAVGGNAGIGTLTAAEATIRGAAVSVAEARISGVLDIVATGDLSLGDAARAATSAAASAVLTTGGAASLSALTIAGTLDLDAAAGAALTDVVAEGSVMLDVASGDIDLAGLTVGGDLGVHAAGGAIVAAIAAGQIGPVVDVTGAARLDASGAVLLSAGGGAPRHVFGGPVSVTRASEVVIAPAADLTLGATDIAFAGIGAETAGGVFDRMRGAVAGGVRVAAQGALGAAGDAAILADGDLRIEAGDVILAGANRIGGAVSAEASSLVWAELGSISLAGLAVGGDVALIAGMDGASGNAAIRQGGTATVTRIGMVDGRADTRREDFAAPLHVTGALDLSTGLAPGRALASVSDVEVDRDVALGDRGNIFGGTLALRRITGAATITEESGVATVGIDDVDGGELHVRQVEVLGDITLTTSDDVIFDGRLSALRDEETPGNRPSIPDGIAEDDPARQGLADLGEGAFRLWLSDGTRLRVDATAGGQDPSGGMIRFDRPVDGFHDRLPLRTLQSVSIRGGGAAIDLVAGAGHVRLRDFLGAAAPLGDVSIISAGDVSLGHTYAGRDPDAASPKARYLLSESDDYDVFYASDLSVEATGDVTLFTPNGLLALFERRDDFFGLNLLGLSFGQVLQPASLELFGFIDGSSRKAAGLFPVGPRAPIYNLNGCVIGDVADCTGVAAPNVLTVLRLDRAQILNVEREDLFELFVSYGNEELWGLPPGYILDLIDLGLAEEAASADETAVGPLATEEATR